MSAILDNHDLEDATSSSGWGAQYDEDGDGRISFNEFVHFYNATSEKHKCALVGGGSGGGGGNSGEGGGGSEYSQDALTVAAAVAKTGTEGRRGLAAKPPPMIYKTLENIRICKDKWMKYVGTRKREREAERRKVSGRHTLILRQESAVFHRQTAIKDTARKVKMDGFDHNTPCRPLALRKASITPSHGHATRSPRQRKMMKAATKLTTVADTAVAETAESAVTADSATQSEDVVVGEGEEKEEEEKVRGVEGVEGAEQMGWGGGTERGESSSGVKKRKKSNKVKKTTAATKAATKPVAVVKAEKAAKGGARGKRGGQPKQTYDAGDRLRPVRLKGAKISEKEQRAKAKLARQRAYVFSLLYTMVSLKIYHVVSYKYVNI